MAFLAFCMLFGVVVVSIWGVISSKGERAKLVAEFNEAPMKMIFLIAWISAAFMFFFGILVPVFGNKFFLNTELKFWQVGGVAFFGGWIVSWFLKL